MVSPPSHTLYNFRESTKHRTSTTVLLKYILPELPFSAHKYYIVILKIYFALRRCAFICTWRRIGHKRHLYIKRVILLISFTQVDMCFLFSMCCCKCALCIYIPDAKPSSILTTVFNILGKYFGATRP